ncbi:uncharacterized protein METZ01_LOCUS216317, partial [marine metagenome]
HDNADDCSVEWGNSTDERQGCPDSDGDGVANKDDAWPHDPDNSWDRDKDGISEATEGPLDRLHERNLPRAIMAVAVISTLVSWVLIHLTKNEYDTD